MFVVRSNPQIPKGAGHDPLTLSLRHGSEDFFSMRRPLFHCT